jgi:hypothetical protein
MKSIRLLRRSLMGVLVACFLLFSSSSYAAWTLTPSTVAMVGHYLTWKVVCTSDGNSLSATNLISLMNSGLRSEVQGATHMIMTVVPGTGAVAPDTTIDVTLSNSQGVATFVHTGYSNVANTTGIDLSEDYNQYLVPYELLYLTLNDIGTSGDQVTLYFEAWIE